ncbi:MAG: hypothetical protein AB7I27_17430 [Bacteriovoracaceae bacterium]
MKLILFTCFFVFTSLASATPHATSSRVNTLLQFIANYKGIRNFGLKTLISNRCSRYLNLNDAIGCDYAVERMIQILDFDIIFTDGEKFTSSQGHWNPRAFVFVAFKKNLLQILSDPKTTEYLKNLNERLNLYLQNSDKNLNIWDVTLEFYSPRGAAKTIAALFQDTSRMKLHLAYLEKINSGNKSSFHANKELLSRVIDNINMILDLSEDNYRKLFYPDEIWKNLNRNIYHFYVPLYLASALEESEIQRKYAYIAPFMLNLTYEFITTGKDFRYIFSDPERLDPESYIGKIKDIFGGYCGSNYGIKNKNFKNSFEIIKEAFARSSSDAVDLMLQLN